MNLCWKLTRPFIFVLACTIGYSGYDSYTGNVTGIYHTQQGTDPAGPLDFTDFDQGLIESADNVTVYLFAERQQFTLTSNLTIDTVTPGTYTSTNEPSGATISSGTEVDSFLLHFDPVTDNFTLREASGSITFDVPILGVICGQANLIASDGLGIAGTSFQSGDNYRGTVSGNEPAGDSFTLSSDLRTVTFTFQTRLQYMEELRIITEGTSTVPVTPAFFKATPSGRGTQIEWATATEAGNAGFHLYQFTEKGWQRVNDKLIASQSVDGLTPSTYFYQGAKSESKAFRLGEVDIFGQERFHGPYQTGKAYGRPVNLEPINWQMINQQHDSLQRARLLQRSQNVNSVLNSIRGGADVSAFTVAEIQVQTDGIQRVTFGDLLTAGIDLSGVQGDDIALTERARPLAIRLGGLSKGIFGPNSFVEFLGVASNSMYSNINVYELQLDASLAQRIIEDDSPLVIDQAPLDHYWASSEVYEDAKYSFSSPTGDPWYQESLLAYTINESFDFEIYLDHVTSEQATLFVDLWGVTTWETTPDHHVVTYVNGVMVDNAFFDGLTEYGIQVDLPAGLVHEGANQITLSLPGDTGVDYDLIYLEGYAVQYERSTEAKDGVLDFEAAGRVVGVSGLNNTDVVIYRILDGNVVHISEPIVQQDGASVSVSFNGHDNNARYVVASSDALQKPVVQAPRPFTDITSGQADLLIISHPDFIGGLASLVSARQSQGYVTRVVDVEDIYSQFGQGTPDAQSIRDYIAVAAGSLNMSYVLLVGGDTYDYFDRLNLGSISFIPSLYAKTHHVVYFAPVDPLYTDLNGDNAPDLPIGRFPVRTLAELDFVIQKTLQFPNAGHQRSAILASDTGFSDVSSTLSMILPANWQVNYADIDISGVANARVSLLNALNQGTALTSFFGHSAPTLWTFDGLFHANDSVGLTNYGKPTIVTQWGCWNTYHVDPRYNTLGHKFLLSGNQGAAAVLGGVSLTDESSDRLLGEVIFANMIQGGYSIGDAIQDAKAELQNTHAGMDVILGWTLLGDPTLALVNEGVPNDGDGGPRDDGEDTGDVGDGDGGDGGSGNGGDTGDGGTEDDGGGK